MTYRFKPRSLAGKRYLLVLFIFLQLTLLVAHLAYQRSYIEAKYSHILRNTTLLQAKQFDTSLDAMRYQLRVIGNAILLNNTVHLNNVDAFLQGELKREWLDAVVVFDTHGDFVAKKSNLPLENILSAETLSLATFRNRPLYNNLRHDKVKESLFYWQSNGTDAKTFGFVMYRAVIDSQGKYLGGIVGYFSAFTLRKIFQKLQSEGFDLGSGGAMAVLDRENDIQLARMGAGSVVTPDRNEPDPRLEKLLHYASDSAQVHHYVSPIDGITRMGTFLNLNEKKWVLAVGLAEDYILHGWYLQVIGASLGMCVIALMQWLLLHYMHANFLQREQLAREAQYDPLTGLANRRYFNEWAQQASNLAYRHQLPFCVIMLDLDYFKKINDCYGHDGGDAVLKSVAQILPRMIRQSDLAARFGGEEFVIALPCTELESAVEVAERIRARFAAQEIDYCGQTIQFTASFGVARMTRDELVIKNGIHAALTRADTALYRSKQAGRNRVSVEHEQ